MHLALPAFRLKCAQVAGIPCSPCKWCAAFISAPTNPRLMAGMWSQETPVPAALAALQVYEALRQLGLHTTAAGRQAVAAARPARQPRPDTLTSAQRQGLGV